MNNCTIVLFGASGDLARRKIIPALYQMVARNKLDKFLLIGAALDDLTTEAFLERSKEFIFKFDDLAWRHLVKSSHYQKLHFTNKSDFQTLNALVEKLETEHAMSGNRFIYLAAASEFFCDITNNIAATGLAKKENQQEKKWYRIIYEKPFGTSLKSAQEINQCIQSYFDEKQIFRIDHFLTKELVGNIALVRFTNCVFEPLWNNRFIDQVQIILNESIGIEGRGAYYDKYGALADVVQNHMLEMLALIGMEAPEKLTGDFVRNERAKVLSKVQFVDGILGQYEGYKKEKNVSPNSNIETFAALHLTVDNPRWAGVPFYLKTGKYLAKKETVIHIKFKKVDCLLAKKCPSEPNYLTIEIAPQAGFILKLNAKTVGKFDEVEPIKMEFCHSCVYSPYTSEDYEILFEEIIRGEQSIVVRFDEIEYAWKLIDLIKEKNLPLFEYKKGSQGPIELSDFEKKHGMRWLS